MDCPDRGVPNALMRFPHAYCSSLKRRFDAPHSLAAARRKSNLVSADFQQFNRDAIFFSVGRLLLRLHRSLESDAAFSDFATVMGSDTFSVVLTLGVKPSTANT